LVSIYAEDPTSYVSSKLVPIIEAYASLSNKIQHTPNPSGVFDDLSGLGEPKFQVDGSPFTENWGRPQRDGPPLRAITLMSYLNVFNSTHPSLWTSQGGLQQFADLYDSRLPANSTIKADLEYVAHFWRESGFDLWEEVNGMHFFTAIVQLRALREGSKLAASFADYGAARFYHDQADRIEHDLLPRFWDENRGHLIETLDSPRSGLDCGLLLGAIHGTPTTCSTDPDSASQCSYAPYSDEVLVSLLAMVKDQRYRFPINIAPTGDNIDDLQGVGVGRYPEDGYDGYETIPGTGNPWFLCTSSVSEILYRTQTHLTATGELKVTKRGLPFWKALVLNNEVKEGKTYRKGDAVFDEAVERLTSTGDSFLKVLRTHTNGEGSFSEQFDRVTGFMRGATDLTWSYGAFLQAIKARGATA
jgi:glucoamylase